jgi:MFS family permease
LQQEFVGRFSVTLFHLLTYNSVLGAAEAGYYPCVIYYLAFWFRPEELAQRVAAFYSFGQVSGFVGGFIAFAVSFADGRLAGWRWLFIVGWSSHISQEILPP